MPFKDPDTKRAYNHAYNIAHKAEISAKRRVYYQAHKAEISAKYRVYYQARKAKKAVKDCT